MKVLDLFSGIGGFSLGLEAAGMETVAFCEKDSFCRKVLQQHWPDVPVYEDVRALDGRAYRGSVDVVCGGFPCQPSQLQDSSKARQMTVTSGLKCYESLASVGRAGLLEKTFLGSSTWHSTMCHLTWKTKATKSGRLYFQLAASMRDTAEIESGLWATPSASMGGGVPTDAEARGWKWMGTYWMRPDGSKFQTQLIDQARMWRTPMTSDWKNMDSANQLSLAKQVKEPKCGLHQRSGGTTTGRD